MQWTVQIWWCGPVRGEGRVCSISVGTPGHPGNKLPHGAFLGQSLRQYEPERVGQWLAAQVHHGPHCGGPLIGGIDRRAVPQGDECTQHDARDDQQGPLGLGRCQSQKSKGRHNPVSV